MNFKWTTNFYFGLFISFFAFMLSSCKKENRCDCIKRTGDIIQETRDGEESKADIYSLSWLSYRSFDCEHLSRDLNWKDQ